MPFASDLQRIGRQGDDEVIALDPYQALERFI
jgi:hypothetical protein